MTAQASLGKKLHSQFIEVSGKRSGYEDRWIKDLRQYKGIYDPDILAKIPEDKSKSFIRETRTKIRTIDARLMDLLFPANGEKNYGILPTPVPVLPAEQEQKIIKMITEVLKASGEHGAPTQEQMDIAKKSYVSESCKQMEKEIDDQLAEIKYRGIIRNVLHSGNLYGTGWLKGPLVNQVFEKRWSLSDGSWKLSNTPIDRPYAEFKPIWAIYPDLSATEIEDCRFIYERHIMPRHKLMELTTREDFMGDKIREYIRDNPEGKATTHTYETTLYNLSESNDTKPKSLNEGQYELIEYWGYVTGKDLLDLDFAKYYPDVEDALLNEYAVNIFLLGDEIVKLAIEPVAGVVLPYYAYYFDKDETSIFGEGIATIMRDPQRLVNASIRAMIDNASHCAGPQYEVNMDLLAEGEDATDAGAFKIWMRTGKEADIAGKEVVRVKQIQSYTPEFMQMHTLFSRLGDEVTIIPRYMQGDARVSGAGRTASGLSMLMGQANVGLSDLIKMFDDGITKPFISAMYNWNMQFNTRDDIKGDMKIVARGSTALMAKEIRAQQIQQFLQMTLNDVDRMWVKRGNLLREWANSTDIGAENMVNTQEEYDAIMQKQQAMLAEQMKQHQGGGEQGGAGYNQLTSVVKQLEDAIQMIAERQSQTEQVMQQLMTMLKRNNINQGGIAQ